ncbi:MAG TPA: hypothetical protein VLE43_06700, partial [Candidatus Saccharimonadia bacterium]|nr:hypothetical protein [Candidatus Saccharimonadia bacterium]
WPTSLRVLEFKDYRKNSQKMRKWQVFPSGNGGDGGLGRGLGPLPMVHFEDVRLEEWPQKNAKNTKVEAEIRCPESGIATI